MRLGAEVKRDCGSRLQFGLAFWLVVNQSAALTDWQSVFSRRQPDKSSQLRVERGRGEQRRSLAVCCDKESMLSNGTSLVSGNPWSFWGKPTGNGPEAVTVEPNVGPPERKKHLERMEPDKPEEPLSGWEQMLERVAAMWRDQAEANRQLLEGLQDLRHRAAGDGHCLP